MLSSSHRMWPSLSSKNRKLYKTHIEAISNDGNFLITKNGVIDIANDRFMWNWKNGSPSGMTIIDETQTKIINIEFDLITVKDLLTGKTLEKFHLVRPNDKSYNILGGIWSSETNKLVLKLKEPEVWILDLSNEAT